MPLQQTGRLPAAEPARVMARLCFHFSRKVPAQHDAAQGRAEFEWGCCWFTVRDQALDLELEAPDGECLQRLRGVIDAHVALFSRKQPMAVTWHAARG